MLASQKHATPPYFCFNLRVHPRSYYFKVFKYPTIKVLKETTKVNATAFVQPLHENTSRKNKCIGTVHLPEKATHEIILHELIHAAIWDCTLRYDYTKIKLFDTDDSAHYAEEVLAEAVTNIYKDFYQRWK